MYRDKRNRSFLSALAALARGLGVTLLYSLVFTVALTVACMAWLSGAGGEHLWVDLLAMLAGFVLTWKSSYAMYLLARYALSESEDWALSIRWQPQGRMLRDIVLSIAVIWPCKVALIALVGFF